MGNKKGYVPSEETRRKVSEALKKAYAEGRGRQDYTPTEETKQKQSASLKQAYAEGRMVLTGAALQQSLKPKKSETERKARKLETQRDWRARNPEKIAGYRQDQNATRYGLTREEYEAPLLCDICKRPQQGRCKLAQDHAHGCCPEKTACDKCRRGRLCTNCNTLLGSAHDSVEVLQQAILYLKSFKGK
jgi:uncharacterized protein YciI